MTPYCDFNVWKANIRLFSRNCEQERPDRQSAESFCVNSQPGNLVHLHLRDKSRFTSAGDPDYKSQVGNSASGRVSKKSFQMSFDKEFDWEVFMIFVYLYKN